MNEQLSLLDQSVLPDNHQVETVRDRPVPHPDMSPDQEAAVDKLVDNGGFTYGEAMRYVGIGPVASHVEITEVKHTEKVSPRPVASRPRPPKNTWRQKAAADREWPEHLRPKR